MAKRAKRSGQELFDPRKMREIAEQMIREGRMPPPEEFFKWIAEARERYRTRFLAARQDAKKNPSSKP